MTFHKRFERAILSAATVTGLVALGDAAKSAEIPESHAENVSDRVSKVVEPSPSSTKICTTIQGEGKKCTSIMIAKEEQPLAPHSIQINGQEYPLEGPGIKSAIDALLKQSTLPYPEGAIVKK